MADPDPKPMTIDGSDQDLTLARSQYLTRYEVLTRRSRRVNQLSRVYRDHYWSLMEKVKAKYREYYWVYGKSPFKEDEKKTSGLENGTDGAGENGWFGAGTGDVEGKCAVAGCKAKAMALTRFCHAHILSDSKQRLYTGCTYVIKSAHAGPILCGKPVLRSTIPVLCATHLQKSEKYLKQALKKQGLNVTSPIKLVPKFHAIVMENVRQIQSKRRAAKKASLHKIEI
ncbi:INO80 complex subunit D-like isoform X1 [Tripterygium wilfordii]|uniref:INO80 complex subunit D-like isoform X1 n=1 Tax=Tripterygium wilfordii TaxID=458696 RepID=A0A7J7D5F0_TRIWF|nr:INO80 complex subunit D-like [Tripterygium wilfordii]KAF5741570.1 INO80 complex subunit D-like isoform X1 [Tripterygium wilfordii]